MISAAEVAAKMAQHKPVTLVTLTDDDGAILYSGAVVEDAGEATIALQNALVRHGSGYTLDVASAEPVTIAELLEEWRRGEVLCPEEDWKA